MSDMDDGDDGAVQQQAAEREARKQGWRPAEEFRGNQDDWVDAPTYLKRGKEIRTHVKAENERLTRELQAANSQISEMKGTIEEIREYHANMEERAINAAIERLKKERKNALTGGDAALAADIDEEIQELKDAPRMSDKLKKGDGASSPTPTPAPTGTPAQQPPEVTQWLNDNRSWYNDDPENEDLVDAANGIMQRVAKRNDLSLAEKADEVTRRVKAAFPDRFGTPRQKVSLTPGGGEGGGSGRPKNNSVSSLPEDAKQAGARYVKQGLYKDMAEYAAEYWKQPGAQTRG